MVILLLVVIYIAFISLGLPDSMFGVTWPLMHLDLGLDEGFAAVYMLVVGICTASVSFVAGPIIRKLGTEWVTSVSVTLTAVGMFGIGISKNIWIMMIFAVMLGIGAGAIDTALNDFVSKHYKARHMSWLHGFWGIGVTLSPLIMSVFLAQGGWRGGYMTMSYIQFSLSLVMFLSIPLWKYVRKIHQQQNSQSLKDNTLASNKKMLDKSLDSSTKVSVEISAITPQKRFNIFKERGVVLAGLALALYCGMEYIVGLWGASYLVNMRSLTPAMAAKYVSLYYGGIMVGRFITGALTIKVSNKILIRGGTVLASLGFLFLAIPVTQLLFPGLILIGLGFGPIFPTSIDATKSRFNPKYSADIIGFQMGFAYIGAFISQLIFGYTATRTTWSIFPYVLLAMSVLLFLCVELVNAKTKDRHCLIV